MILALMLFLPAIMLAQSTCVEAETLNITGGALYDPNSIILWGENGTGTAQGPVNIPNAATYVVNAIVFGSPLGGIWPNMQVQIDGNTIGQVDVGASDWRTVNVANMPIASGIRQLKLIFTNDAYDAGEDRNLYIDKVCFEQAPAPPVLQPPVTATASVTIEWDPNDPFDAVTEYRIYRKQTGEFALIGVTAGATQYKDLTVQNSQTYSYAVSAVNHIGESDMSDPLSVTVPPAPATNPCVTYPVKVTVGQWPGNAIGTRQLRYTVTGPAAVQKIEMVWLPKQKLVVTDARGCTGEIVK